MKNATLVIMAAGIGSRFGKGVKQLEPIGPNGEIIIDYSIYDAIEAGFNKVVFVIRKSIEKEFKEIIGNRIEKKIKVAYAYQELEDIPGEFRAKAKNRQKPWGTGQAILCCKDIIKEPFLVINADDYYGKEAYHVAYNYLIKGNSGTVENDDSDVIDICMVGFILKNTLSFNGTVTRGICKLDEEDMLVDIHETYEIKEENGKAIAMRENKCVNLSLEVPVSMNMWGFPASVFPVLEKKFYKFLEELKDDEIKKEYLLPQIIGQLLKEKRIQVKVLHCSDKWFGMTYREDKEKVVQQLQELINRGLYPKIV